MGAGARQRGVDDLTVTGRRQTSPNLQNLPVRTEVEIRDVFGWRKLSRPAAPEEIR